MANPSANLCIVHGVLASDIKAGVDQTSGKQSSSFWLEHPSHDNKTLFKTPVRLLGDVANRVRDLAPGNKITVEGRLRSSESNKYLKIIEGWDASW